MDAVEICLTNEKSVGLSAAKVDPDHDPGLKIKVQLVDIVINSLKGRAKF